MSVQTTYPGVYIQEVPSGVHSIVGVSTSVTAFVGAARMGPTQVPVEVHSVPEYTRTFGLPWDRDHPMGHAVGHFFGNGGSVAVVVRVPTSTASAAEVTLKNEAAQDVLVLTANGQGAWANQVGAVGMDVSVDNNTSNQNDLFNLVISLRGIDPRSGASVLQAQETYQNLSMAPKNPRYALTTLANSNLVKAALAAGIPAAAGGGFSKSKTTLTDPVAGLPANPITLTLSVDGGPPTDISFSPASGHLADIVAALNAALAAAGVPATAAAGADFIRITSTSTDPGNTSVVVTPSAAADASQVLGLGLAWAVPGVATSPEEASGSASLRPAVTTAPTGLKGGSDGGTGNDGVVGPGDVVPSGSGSGGIYALNSRLFPRFNLLCLPDVPASDPAITSAPATNSQALTTAMGYCRDQRAFLLVDTPRDPTKPQDWNISPPALGGLPALGEHAAIYYPRLLISEAGPGGITRQFDVPPCGAVAGVMASIDASRGVWKAPAGLGAGIVGASDLSVGTSDAVSGNLNPQGVNVLRTFPGAGMVVWGARTLKGADSQTSDFKYVPVRRLTDYIASSLYLGTQFAVFEPNDPELWGQLRLAVGTFMRRLFRQGAFQQSPKRAESDSFFVVCDETVNPQSEIDLGRVNVVVGFAPLKPAEFVIVTITQISSLEA
jgi:phage tail sheath protein FI